jgi:hypothetical protein
MSSDGGIEVPRHLGAVPPPPPTRDYLARRIAEGNSKNEVMRCLKRYLAREIFHAPQPPRTTAKIIARHRSICSQAVAPRRDPP